MKGFSCLWPSGWAVLGLYSAPWWGPRLFPYCGSVGHDLNCMIHGVVTGLVAGQERLLELSHTPAPLFTTGQDVVT